MINWNTMDVDEEHDANLDINVKLTYYYVVDKDAFRGWCIDADQLP